MVLQVYSLKSGKRRTADKSCLQKLSRQKTKASAGKQSERKDSVDVRQSWTSWKERKNQLGPPERARCHSGLEKLPCWKNLGRIQTQEAMTIQGLKLIMKKVLQNAAILMLLCYTIKLQHYEEKGGVQKMTAVSHALSQNLFWSMITDSRSVFSVESLFDVVLQTAEQEACSDSVSAPDKHSIKNNPSDLIHSPFS